MQAMVLAGALGSFSVLGGTNSLVSVDAMQEFRIQTSTYAPEFGRTPGGQISIVTRSGTNQFHGTAFDYFRNDVLDANNWFNGYTNNPPLPKAKERQNDFGGTLGGPIVRDRTFFFFSYEGLRLRLPQTAISTVPDVASRQSAVAAMQPFLNAYPMPNGSDDPATGMAQFNASFSNPASVDAYSIRIDQRLGKSLNVFGRYNYSPSEIAQRGTGGTSLNTVSTTNITTHTATVGATWSLSPTIASDFRFNYSRASAHLFSNLDSFGGGVPPTSLPLPGPYSPQNSSFLLDIFSLQLGSLSIGDGGLNLQRQINIVGNTSIQIKSHTVKVGIDFRRLSPESTGAGVYQLITDMVDVPSAQMGSLSDAIVTSMGAPTFHLGNVGVYAQDTWKVIPRLTITYGLRWDLDLAPSSNPALPAVVGFNLNNLSGLALAPAGTELYGTRYGNVAPRVGGAYQLSGNPNWQTVLRGGFGVFYDLASSELGNNTSAFYYPFGNRTITSGGTFPPSPAQLVPPPIAPPDASSGILFAINPHLRLPYTLEWNVATEQGLGSQQTLSLSYVGAAGRRLLQEGTVLPPVNANLFLAILLTNAGTSDYDAFQAQFRRRLSRGVQALASYTWSHSMDTASAGSNYGGANALLPSGQSQDRGPSDFDLRHTFSAALTYDVPALKSGALTKALLGGWSTDNIITVRSAQPVGISDANFSTLANFSTIVRPDLVAGQPLYLYGSQYPGGKGFNPSAFVNPPTTPAGCNPGPPSFDFPCDPARQGNLGRNALRGFGAIQWDFAVHRDFPIHESLHLQFRAEMFNALNHPNFGPPSGCLGSFCSAPFGISNQLLSQNLSGSNLGGGGFSPLYQIGGPRSIQFALKLIF